MMTVMAPDLAINQPIVLRLGLLGIPRYFFSISICTCYISQPIVSRLGLLGIPLDINIALISMTYEGS